MHLKCHIVLLLALLTTLSVAQSPNVIVILADDLGYGELGCYGQEIIETPNIDRLAERGMLFTDHYSGAAVCAPARCILLTGKHGGHAYIRGNDEWDARGRVWNFEAVLDSPMLEGQRPLPDSVVTVAEVLKTEGYSTAFVGKWGLGAPDSEGTPLNQGFDYFFGYNCQRQAHTLYPTHLWENDDRFVLNNPLVAPHTALPDSVDRQDPAHYQRFISQDYAPDVMHDKALQWLDANAENPFFLVYASPLPHLPLQAPQRWTDYYKGRITEESPYDGGNGYFPSYAPRATYAAMISTLDEQVGEIVAVLDELDIADNTVILFTSDNGPTYTGGADTEYFKSAAPFRTDYGRGKGFLYEGGIRVPMIAVWPGTIDAGLRSDHISVFYDYLPTISQIAGIEEPQLSDGISFYNSLIGMQQKQHTYLYWEQPEYGGQQAVRMGKWKAYVGDLHKGNVDIKLFDLEQDPQESIDLSKSHPEILADMKAIMSNARTSPVVPRFYLPDDK